MQHTGSYLRAAFTDAGGEHDAIDPPHTGGQSAGCPCDMIDEIFYCQPCQGRLTRQQDAHIVRYPRQTLQAAIGVEKMLDPINAPALLLLQPKDDAGIQRPRARSHR
jgi:hypothetical protein